MGADCSGLGYSMAANVEKLRLISIQFDGKTHLMPTHHNLGRRGVDIPRICFADRGMRPSFKHPNFTFWGIQRTKEKNNPNFLINTISDLPALKTQCLNLLTGQLCPAVFRISIFCVFSTSCHSAVLSHRQVLSIASNRRS